MTMKRAWLVAAGAALLISTAAAQQAPKLPPGGDPALACGQYPAGRAYWTEYAFCDVPVKGPAKARGLVLWSHGVSGTAEQYHGTPPQIIRRLATGWDVVKINRNNLYESGWVTSGTRHRDDLIARVKAARDQGYKAVIAAGQSYGGAIALEANAKAGGIDAVLAFAPGHGSDVNGSAASKAYPNLDRYLLQAAEGQNGGRIVVMVAENDEFHPNRRGPANFIGPRLRQALGRTGQPFVLLDETMPVAGHGAAYTTQFDAWFGACVIRFLQAATTGETACAPPDPPPRFLLPANLKRTERGPEGMARWLGTWTGSYDDGNQTIGIFMESIGEAGAELVYAGDAGPSRAISMGWERRKATWQGDTLSITRSNARVLTLRLLEGDGGIVMEHRNALGAVSRGTLRPQP